MSYTSVLGNIATVLRDLSNIIFFEFSKYDNEKGENTFLYATLLYTLPTEINYTYPSRNKFTQTMEGGFLDKFPMGLPKIKMSGTFGKERRGLMYFDGLTRLQLFKELIIKQYHKVETKKIPYTNEFNYKIKNALLGKYKLSDTEVYVLTMYDFINSEVWLIDPTSFDISESARSQSNLPRYDLRMQAIGKPLGGVVDDILQKTLDIRNAALAIDQIMGTMAIQERFKTQIDPVWEKFKTIFRA